MSGSIHSHPLAELLHRVASGVFPQPDGLVEVFGQPPGPVDAVVAFTAHHVVAADIDPEWVHGQLQPGDLLAPMSAPFLSALGERLRSRPRSLDVVLCAMGEPGTPEISLVELAVPVDHPRVNRAQRYRTHIKVYATPDRRGVLIVGRGLAGRWEAALEVEAPNRNRGLGRALVAAARRLVEPDQPLFMQTAPGNAASLRAILAGGFRPIGGEVLFPRSETPDFWIEP